MKIDEILEPIKAKLPLVETYTFREIYEDKELDIEKPIIEGLIDQGEFILLSAPAKIGKTWFALAASVAVATGVPLFDYFRTVQGNVLYFQIEVSKRGFKKRINRFTHFFSDESDMERVVVSPTRLLIDDERGFGALYLAIETLKPILVVIDPLYCIHVGDENAASQMAPLLTKLSQLAKNADIGILLIHHQGKRGENSSGSQTGHQHRGSSTLADVPDGSISMNKQGGALGFKTEMRNREGDKEYILKPDDDFYWIAKPKDEKEDLKVLVNQCFEDKDHISSNRLIDQLCSVRGVAKSTAGKTIKLMCDSGLVTMVREGRNVFYSHTAKTSHSSSTIEG